MTIKHSLRKFIWRLGYDVVPFRRDKHYLARRCHLIHQSTIDTVLDVGANVGQFAIELRNDIGYLGDIVSFEPLSSAFGILEQRTQSDRKWRALNVALGDEDGIKEINISENSLSSSILDILPSHLEAAPLSKSSAREKIVTKRLDSIFDTICSRDGNVYLKMDVQGFERHVIRGAELSLRRVKVIQMEMSLTPLYEGESSFGEMHVLVESLGYRLFSLEPGFADGETGQLLQVDGIYVRERGAS